MMFNRLRTIWPKGYQHGSPEKSHQKGDYLKTSNAKKWLFLGFCAGNLEAGPPRGGKRDETMTAVPMEFRRPIRGPMGFKGPLDFRGRMEMTLTNQFVEYRGPFFFLEITSKSEENCGIFLFFFEVHKAGDAQYLI